LTADALDNLRSLTSTLVARIYLDTPFNSNRDYAAPVSYRQNKHVLFGQQKGPCNGCRSDFPLRVLEVDQIIPRGRGQDHIEHLQLLCAPCNRVEGDRPQEYLVARLEHLGIAA